jgi:hypothetical protein
MHRYPEELSRKMRDIELNHQPDLGSVFLRIFVLFFFGGLLWSGEASESKKPRVLKGIDRMTSS